VGQIRDHGLKFATVVVASVGLVAPVGEDRQVIVRRVAVVFLVDRRGRILMQHRTPDARVSPNQWAVPGGKIEPLETPEQAARREVYEETGIRLDAVEPFWTGTRPSVSGPPEDQVEINAFYALTDARQEDVVLGEGQAMVFLHPDEALALDLGVTAALLLPRFVASPEYARLRPPV
jgi:8-oxo-dGTP diphosphatase